MKIRILMVIIALTAVSLVSYTLLANGGVNKGFLTAVIKSQGVKGASVKQLEEISDGKFLISYFIERESVVNALGAPYDAVIIETNYSYPFVFELGFLDGGFFSHSAQKNKEKQAVLNKTAAFRLFGGVKITGNEVYIESEVYIENEKYVVTGVIEDNEEEANIFVPAFSDESRPRELFCPIDNSAGITPEYLMSELKYIGVTESSYDFFYEKNRLSAVWEGISSVFSMFLHVNFTLFRPI